MPPADESISALMYKIGLPGLPFSLAGSIRDDGPLPHTELHLIQAREAYAEIINDDDLIVKLSTLPGSMRTGNMTPSWYYTGRPALDPSAGTELADRGTSQIISVARDVGMFLRALNISNVR